MDVDKDWLAKFVKLNIGQAFMDLADSITSESSSEYGELAYLIYRTGSSMRHEGSN